MEQTMLRVINTSHGRGQEAVDCGPRRPHHARRTCEDAQSRCRCRRRRRRNPAPILGVTRRQCGLVWASGFKAGRPGSLVVVTGYEVCGSVPECVLLAALASLFWFLDRMMQLKHCKSVLHIQHQSHDCAMQDVRCRQVTEGERSFFSQKGEIKT